MESTLPRSLALNLCEWIGESQGLVTRPEEKNAILMVQKRGVMNGRGDCCLFILRGFLELKNTVE